MAIKMSFFCSSRKMQSCPGFAGFSARPKRQQPPRAGLRASPPGAHTPALRSRPPRLRQGLAKVAGASVEASRPRATQRPAPPRPAGWTPEWAQPHRPQPAPAPWARAPPRTARRARPRRPYSLPMAAAGRPTGHGGSARSPLGSPGWASAPLPTRSGGCAQTPPRITWRACGSRSPAPWGRALGACADVLPRGQATAGAAARVLRSDPEPRRARGSSGLPFASTCPSSASSRCGVRDSHVGAGQGPVPGAQAGSFRRPGPEPPREPA